MARDEPSWWKSILDGLPPGWQQAAILRERPLIRKDFLEKLYEVDVNVNVNVDINVNINANPL